MCLVLLCSGAIAGAALAPIEGQSFQDGGVAVPSTGSVAAAIVAAAAAAAAVICNSVQWRVVANQPNLLSTSPTSKG